MRSEGHQLSMVKRKQFGFTIVELLIVIVVIGILAGITVVAYSGVQNRAHDAAIQSDIGGFVKKISLSAATDAASAYPFPLTVALDISFSKDAYEPRNNLYYCKNASTNQFSIGAISKSGRGFLYDSTNGLQTYTNGSSAVSGAATCSLIGLTWNTAYATMALDESTTGTPTWASWVN